MSDSKWISAGISQGSNLRGKIEQKVEQNEEQSFQSTDTSQSQKKQAFLPYYFKYNKESQEKRFQDGSHTIYHCFFSGGNKISVKQQNKEQKNNQIQSHEIDEYSIHLFTLTTLSSLTISYQTQIEQLGSSIEELMSLKKKYQLLSSSIEVQLRESIRKLSKDLISQSNEKFLTTIKEMNTMRSLRVWGLDVQFFSEVMLLKETYYGKQVQQHVIATYPYIRITRGDGNCVFSSLAFSYLEYIFIHKEFDIILNNLVVHDIYWDENQVKKILIDKQVAKQQLFFILSQLKKHSQMPNMDLITYSNVILEYMNKVNGFYDLMVIYMRSLIIESFNIYSKKEPFRNFFDEASAEEFLDNQSTFEKEGSFESICFFSEFTSKQVEVVVLSDDDPIDNSRHFEKKNQTYQTKEKVMTLMYHNGHYSILYTHDIPQLGDSQLIKIDFNGLWF